jgi:hypothetical protein
MNKIVRHYPVAHLPADLRANLPDHRRVKIEFELEAEPDERVLLAPLAGSVPNVHGHGEEVVEYIRQLREDR